MMRTQTSVCLSNLSHVVLHVMGSGYSMSSKEGKIQKEGNASWETS